MSKVVILAIDGLDWELVTKYLESLPNFKRLIKNGFGTKMASVFPPDTPTAWASIYTGMNPARHGVVTFRDPLHPAKLGEHLEKDISGKTFWDILSRQGRKVCILFPHLGYPVWPVNGIMVARTTEIDIKKYDIQTYPLELAKKYDLSKLKPMTTYPLSLNSLIKNTKKLVEEEVRFGLELYRNFDWDLYFIYFSSLDNIQHIFRRYYEDANNSPYKTVIPDFYEFFDEKIGLFLKELDEDTTLIVMSDHGHTRRPLKVVNINEFLRRKGYLVSKIQTTKPTSIPSLLWKKLRKSIADIINEHRLAGKIASLFLKIFPEAINLYTGKIPIEWKKTIAYLSDTSGGIKAYSYAGIRINKNNISEDKYEEIRNNIIEELYELRDPETNENIVKWVSKREDVYYGEYIEKYPDIVFELNEKWGAGWEINSDLYGIAPTYNVHPGCHRRETATFIIYNFNNRDINTEIAKKMSVMDVAPTILDLFDLDVKGFNFDGKSILK